MPFLGQFELLDEIESDIVFLDKAMVTMSFKGQNSARGRVKEEKWSVVECLNMI